MNQNPIYLYRVSDKVYVIYRLTNYGYNNVKEVEAGLAYDNAGNMSKKFERALEKYGIEKHQKGTHSTASSKTQFCISLYLSRVAGADKMLEVPDKVIEIGKELLDCQYADEERRGLRRIKNIASYLAELTVEELKDEEAVTNCLTKYTGILGRNH